MRHDEELINVDKFGLDSLIWKTSVMIAVIDAFAALVCITSFCYCIADDLVIGFIGCSCVVMAVAYPVYIAEYEDILSKMQISDSGNRWTMIVQVAVHVLTMGVITHIKIVNEKRKKKRGMEKPKICTGIILNAGDVEARYQESSASTFEEFAIECGAPKGTEDIMSYLRWYSTQEKEESVVRRDSLSSLETVS